MWLAERLGRQDRPERDLGMTDAVAIGLVQAVALVPGISRSGATISAGLFRRFDRVTATRLSFFLGIPALVAAGGLEAATQFGNVSTTVGWTATGIALVVSFVVAYAAIAWLLRFVSKNNFTAFIVYRLVVAAILAALVLSGRLSA
jgi:undecaprenyl-diphosphatase